MKLAAFILLAASIASPLAAQAVGTPTQKPQQTEAQARAKMREVVIYGNEACPKGNNGEIIICRKGSSDDFRIPKQLRQSEPAAGSSSWGAQQQALDGAGASGIGSCSAVGSGGTSGCGALEYRRAKAEKRQAKAAAAAEDAAAHE